jgi:fructoselysine-6-P-deglycase FrlB-like protein
MDSIALTVRDLGATLAARAANEGPISEVFLVGCGGSLVDLYPARYFLASEGSRLRADLYTANEFVHALPKALGAGSAIVVCSHSGATPEAVAAAAAARARGALVLTLTHNSSAEIAAHADRNIVYEWGDASNVQDNPMAIALSICLEILEQAEGYPHYADFRDAIGRLGDVVASARRRVRGQAEAFAAAYRDENLFYILSSGASFGHAYGFAIGSLMEMQWLDASAIHSGEFFHGPFEITDKHTNFIILVNEGRTRPLDERVIAFLKKHAGRYEVIDTRELGIGALPASVVEFFNPVLLYGVLCEYREALATIRKHPLETRRYMGKMKY